MEPGKSHPQLNDRALSILRALVEQYIRDGQPVGSRTLSRMPGIGLSPATVRNVMCDLEDMGLLASPHTSAGRMPTAMAYRLFVDTLVEIQPLDSAEVSSIRKQLAPDRSDESLVRSASTYLSQITSMAGVVTIPRRDSARLRQIEFLPLSDRRVLMILVTNEREVQNRVLQVDRDYGESELQQAANYINQTFGGVDLSEVRNRVRSELERARSDMDTQMQSMIEVAGRVFAPDDESPDSGEQSSFVVAGETNLMSFSELSDVEKLRQLFEAFSQKRDVYHLLERSLSADGIQIFIGQESGYQVLGDCSVVTAPYKVDGEVVGALGVIGPTRMAYERVIPVVDVTSRLLGAALNYSR
jgi:heat-inducible transcriptional repressor